MGSMFDRIGRITENFILTTVPQKMEHIWISNIYTKLKFFLSFHSEIVKSN